MKNYIEKLLKSSQFDIDKIYIRPLRDQNRKITLPSFWTVGFAAIEIGPAITE